ncbi:hypothetical protein PV10_08224 [Exophiala mesophila]|uniref:Luciferase domain-containing protein n=1 Tax=Exophiala mesophila TaxID=212818 RepID=A0A0D1XK39_EXOME|nr:uncharacterized protein PV10_08224 [Exophiala mesophila]KIV88551.1 hypothetical protein PV10_08224 [Exophiala mesophila]
MTSSTGPELVFAFAYIIVGSILATCLLTVLKFDIGHTVTSKTGAYLTSALNSACETCLRLFSVADPHSAPKGESSSLSRGYLQDLPHRSGARPTVRGCLNPRQTDQLPTFDKDINGRLRQLLTDTSAKYPESIYLGRSTFEGGNATLFARHRVFDQTKYHGEIVGMHVDSGSMTVTIHPDDVRAVIENGWGQRHPLSSRSATWLRYSTTSAHHTPKAGTQVILYAPRNQEELNLIEQVINAAVWWVGGIDSSLRKESFC